MNSISHDFAILSRSAYKCLSTRIVTETKMFAYTQLRQTGKLVRIKPEIEDLISKVSQLTGYQSPVIRNIAILYGLQIIAMGIKLPKNEEGYKQLLQKTSEEIAKLKVVR